LAICGGRRSLSAEHADAIIPACWGIGAREDAAGALNEAVGHQR
jgi:hypothetical protein